MAFRPGAGMGNQPQLESWRRSILLTHFSEGPCPGAVPVSIATALHGSSGPRVNYMTFKVCGIDSREEEKSKTRKAKKIGSSSHCNQFAGRRILTKFTENTFKRAACKLLVATEGKHEDVIMYLN